MIEEEQIIIEEAGVEDTTNPQVVFEEEPLQFEDDFAEIDSALSIMPEGHSEAYFESKAQQMALIRRAADENLLPDIAYNDSKQTIVMAPQVLGLMEAHQTLYSQKVTNQIRNIIQEDVQRDPTNAPLYQSTLDAADSVETQYQGLMGAQKVLADKYSNEPPTSRYIRDQEVIGYKSDLFKEWTESRNVFQNIYDGIGMIVDPMSFTMDAQDLVEGFNPGTSESEGIQNFKQVVAGYQAADPEVKQRILPELLAEAIEAYDNNEFKVGTFLALLDDPNFSTEGDIYGTLEAVEGGSLLASAPLTAPFKAVKSMQHMLSLRQQMKRFDNAREAVAATRTSNANKVDEAMDADATNWEETILGTNATDGLSPTYQNMVDEIKAQVEVPMREMSEADALVKVEALTDTEKATRKSGYVESMIKESEGQILAAEVIKDTTDGFLVRYQVGTKGTKPVVREQEIKWTVDDAGSLIGVDEKMSGVSASVFGKNLLSPENVMRSIDDNIVSDVTFGGLQSAVMRKSLADVWKKTDQGLGLGGSKARQNVDELLIAGDEAGQVWTAGDMLAGNVQTMSGKIKYTEKEVRAYYAKRAFLNEAHGMQNHIVKRKLEFQGYKEARWTNPLNGIEETQIAKPFKDGRGFVVDGTEDIIAPSLKGEGISISKRGTINVEEAIQQGYTPVKFLNPIKVNGKNIQYGLIPTSAGKQAVRDLPDQVLKKVTGYVPRISKPGYYYVKDVANGSTSTLARFKTKQASEEFVAQKHADQAMNNVPVDKRSSLISVRDRDMAALESVTEDANAYGGLYTGARNKQGIFEGDEFANEMSRLSAGQSVQRMVEGISSQMPLNEYRMAVVDRWKKSAEQAFKNSAPEGVELNLASLRDPQAWKTMSLNGISDNGTREALDAHRTYMIDALRVPLNQENAWANQVMNVADLMPNSKVRDLTVNLASANPLQSLKGATFDAYLGWFNPRQLYIQSQNASLAMSMYPTQALGALKDSMIQRAFLYTPTTDKALLKQAAKGMDVEDLNDMQLSIEQFKRSGLRDGVMRTGDYGANMGGFGQGSLEGFRKIAGAGRIFFEEGESMARLISWNIARRNWKAANPKGVMDDKAIRAISDDTLRMNMNMQRENAAMWQKNPLTSVPTQFLQVQTKLAENLIGGALGNGKWTRKEAAMAFMGQVILYGTVGVPLIEGAASAFKTGAEGDPLTFNEENPNWGVQLDRGVVGTLANAVGLDNNFSESASIIAGFDNNVLYDGITALADLATGESRDIAITAPSIGVAQRGVDTIMTTYQAMRDMAISPSMETVGDSALKIIDSAAAITSTWSNARKIVFLEKLGGMVDSRGDIMISLDNLEDTSFTSLVAAAMGMPLYKQGAYYENKMWNYDRKKAEQDTMKALKSTYNEFRLDGNFEKFEANKAFFLSEYEDQPMKRQDIVNRLIKTIGDGRSKLDKDLYTFMTDYVRTGGKIGTQSFQSDLNQSGE